MDLKRIKTVMIVILIIINAFFVYNLAIEYRDRVYIDDSVLEDAVNILSRSGIEIASDIIPKKKPDTPVYEGLFGEDYNESVAKLLSGSEIESAFSIPQGMRFVAENGSVVEISTDYDVVFYSSDADRYAAFSGIISGALANGTVDDTADFSKDLYDLLCRDISASVGYESFGAVCDGVYRDKESGYSIVKYSQTLGDAPLYGHEIYSVFDRDSLVYMEGKWTFLSTNKEYSSQLYDQVNILFMEKKSVDKTLAEYKERGETPDISLEIAALDSVYCTYFNDDRSGLYFIPAWCITYADGRSVVYDTHSGMQYVEK